MNMFKGGLLGCQNHFGMRSCREHNDLKWGDVTEKTTMNEKVYLIMEGRISKEEMEQRLARTQTRTSSQKHFPWPEITDTHAQMIQLTRPKTS